MATVQSNNGVRSALKNRRCLGVLALALYYLGLWPSDDAPNTWMSYWRHYMPPVQLARWIFTIAVNLININIVWGTWHSVAMFTGNVVMYVAVITRFGSLYLQRQRLADVFTSLESLCSPRMLATEHLYKMAARTEKLSSLYFKTILKIFLVSTGMIQASILVDGFSKRILPFQLWLPYNYSSTPVFEMTLVTTNVLAAIDIFMLAFPSFLFASCCIHLLGQYKLLRYKIENIRILVEKKMKKIGEPKSACVSIEEDEDSGAPAEYTIVSLRGVSNLSADSEIDVHDDSVSSLPADSETAETNDTVSDLPADSVSAQGERRWWWRVIKGTIGQQRFDSGRVRVNQDGGLASTSMGDNIGSSLQRWREQLKDQRTLETGACVEMETFLRHCAKHHQSILRLTKDFERVFKIVLRFQSFGNAIVGLFGLYFTTLAPELDYKAGIIVMYVALVYIEYFQYCWLGNQLTVESEMLREAVYGCEWYGASESFKRSIRIMISRTNKPEVFKAGGLPLSMKSFRFICRTGFYLHNVMVKIIHGVKINDKMS